MHHGDRYHQRLVLLYSHHFSYPGWQQDMNIVETEHFSNKLDPFDRIESMILGILNKQQIHLENRSNSNLVRLDTLKPTLSYPDWENDFKKTEEIHMNRPQPFAFEECMFKLEEKQQITMVTDRTSVY